jgi:hypothetical protein
MGATAGHGGPADLAGGRFWDGFRWVGDDRPDEDGSTRLSDERPEEDASTPVEVADPSAGGSVGGRAGSRIALLVRAVGLVAAGAVLLLATRASPPVSGDALHTWLMLTVPGLLLIAFPIYDAAAHWSARLYLIWTALLLMGIAMGHPCEDVVWAGDCQAVQLASVLVVWLLGAAMLAVFRLVSAAGWPPAEPRGKRPVRDLL